MKLILFIVGLALVAGGVLLLRPIAKHLPEIGFANFLVASFALSMVMGGANMMWAALFV